ncbi:MAG: magnesium chelatase subunit H [Gammaproteobacteria bacterium]|jgi:magnesium chelatase subunit H|nr:magnesium chelatase subunit H [Gammaproteobacteria bacterium]
MPRLISVGEPAPLRVVLVTMDSHLAGATERARLELSRDLPQLELSYHAAANFADDPTALAQCHDDIANGDIVITTMLFLEEHIQAVLPALQARRDHCDAMVGCISASEIVKLTRLGRFSMDGSGDSGATALLKKLRPKKKDGETAGARQMAMLRRLPKILRYIPGTAQDVRAYFLTLQYWLAGSDVNVANMIRLLVDRYADGPRAELRGNVSVAAPEEYPEVGLYHPDMPSRISDRVERLPQPAMPRMAEPGAGGTVGLLLMRSYVLSGDTAHYDGVIRSFEARGIRVIPAFAAGLDCRPAVERFFQKDGHATVDAVVSLTGFSLVGGPAYNDARAAEAMLTQLDVPYVAAHAVEFQSLDQWQASARGLLPVESTIMIAIPELDGATGPIVFGGRDGHAEHPGAHREMRVDADRTARLVGRVGKLIALRRARRAERKVAMVLFNFPPNSGATGTAAYLSVFQSLHNVLTRMKAEGYTVEVPATVDDLRDRLLTGNAEQFGADANVLARIPVDDHVRREPHLAQIEGQWGPAPGKAQSDGRAIQVLGIELGNVVVAVQPGFGYEGDPMRLLFESGFAPTHAFSAFYRWLREDMGAHAVLHFGTHGALEFMPGKQTGLSGACWPDRLIGDLPNFYLYAANNPSEGSIAKRRSAATLISYMTPPVAQAGLYRGLLDLKASLDRWRALPPDDVAERARMVPLIQAQAAELDLAEAEPQWPADGADVTARLAALTDQVLELEYTLIPQGLHVVGRPPTAEERADLLLSMAEGTLGRRPERALIDALLAGADPAKTLAGHGFAADEATVEKMHGLVAAERLMAEDHETPAIIHALDAGFVAPAPGGDLLRTPEILPTGRNLHGFDPFRLPSAFAVADAARQAEKLLERHTADGNRLPETIAMVLWGTDNLKSEGAPIGQALALLGARPRFDGYGRLAGATLLSLEELGRPRIDVMMTLSGIFRDLLPLQIKLLAEAAWLAASADEPEDRNFVRKHALAYQAAHGGSFEDAALRVFSNADGAYGSNVNQLVDSGAWDDEDELADAYTKRKCFAYGRSGAPAPKPELLTSVLGDVELAYQNLESVELGITTVDHYFDTLGGIGRAVRRAKGGEAAPVYIGDQTRGEGKVRSLAEQVALETRTRTLNPKWYEGMLEHGYEGVRQIEAQITNTMGWSATTGAVAPWVYEKLTETFVLDPEMRNRLAQLNAKASARVVNRLLEAHDRQYWTPDEGMLAALQRASEELEDRLEGITEGVAA